MEIKNDIYNDYDKEPIREQEIKLECMNNIISRHVNVPHTWHIVQYSYQHSVEFEKEKVYFRPIGNIFKLQHC